MSERFCELCNCDGKEKGIPAYLNENYKCPVLGGKNICSTDCHYDLGAGFGATDTLGDVMKKTGKLAYEIFQTCLACPHGGQDVILPNKLVSYTAPDGKKHTSGPVFEAAKKAMIEEHEALLKAIKDPRYPDLPEEKAC